MKVLLSPSMSLPSWRFPVWSAAVVASEELVMTPLYPPLSYGRWILLSTALKTSAGRVMFSPESKCSVFCNTDYEEEEGKICGIMNGMGCLWNNLYEQNNFPFLRHQAPVHETPAASLPTSWADSTQPVCSCWTGRVRPGSLLTDMCGSLHTRSGSILWRKRWRSLWFTLQVFVETARK